MPLTREGSLWRNGDFMKLWGGETLSQIGTQVSLLALPLTAITTLHAGPEQLGLLTAAQFVPILLITLFVGVWLDTHRRRPVLLLANCGRAVLLGAIPLLYALDLLTMAALYVIGFLVGILTALFDVAYLVYLPSLVSKGRLVEANAKLEATYSISEVGGPGLGGLLVQILTAPVAILADVLTYVLAGLGILSIRRSEPRATRAGPAESIWRTTRAGLSWTFRDPLLLPLVAVSAVFNLFNQAIFTLYPLYGVSVLHFSPALLGVTLTMGSLGLLAGSFVAQWAGRTFGVGHALVGGMALSSTALLLVPTSSSIVLLVAGLMLYGLGLAVFNVYSLSLRAATIPADLLGRVTATYRFISNGTIPLGGLLGGFLGKAFGVQPAILMSVIPLIVASSVFAFTRIRTISVPSLTEEGQDHE